MKATEVGRELLYPLTERAIVYAMVFYWLLFGLAMYAGLFGIALLFLTVPAYFRFLLYLLDARAHGRSAPVPAIEMFNPVDNSWTLVPLIHIALGIWALILTRANPPAAAITGFVFAVIMPASMAVLSVTHSPLACLNPLAILRMIRACGASYFLVPVVLVGGTAVLILLYQAGVAPFFLSLGLNYEIVLMFSISGTVLHAKGIAIQIDIDEPSEPGKEQLADDLEKQRQQVANHAYGFISRGNREGGFAHIREWLRAESSPEDAWQWFFEAMLAWENTDPALFFAQEYLCQLLDWQREDESLKLIVRCLHENDRWQSNEQSRVRVQELLSRHGREDLLRQLGL